MLIHQHVSIGLTFSLIALNSHKVFLPMQISHLREFFAKQHCSRAWALGHLIIVPACSVLGLWSE